MVSQSHPDRINDTNHLPHATATRPVKTCRTTAQLPLLSPPPCSHLSCAPAPWARLRCRRPPASSSFACADYLLQLREIPTLCLEANAELVPRGLFCAQNRDCGRGTRVALRGSGARAPLSLCTLTRPVCRNCRVKPPLLFGGGCGTQRLCARGVPAEHAGASLLELQDQ